MRRIICILMCLSMASMVSATLSITNGDFEAYGIREDVPSWFDQGDDTLGWWDTHIRLRYSFHDPVDQYMGLPTDESWAYQSIGTAGTAPAVTIQYEFGAPSPHEDVDESEGEIQTDPRNLTLTVSIYELTGSFEGADNTDIDGADGVTLIDSVTVSYPEMAVGEDVVTDAVTLHYLDTTSGELFLRFENVGDGDATVGSGDNATYDLFSIDNVQIIELVSIVNPLPKDDTDSVAVELTSSENDLRFTVTDSDIVKVDVLFASDPNVSSIKTIESVTPGQYTVTLESELASDLDWDTEYFWQVIAYEPNTLGGPDTVKYTTPLSSFTTIQYGPYLGDVIPGTVPSALYVYAGEDAEFTIESYNKTETFQWYKYVDGVSDTMLTDGPTGHGSTISGATTDTLTIQTAQLDDAGIYYCKGTYTEAGPTVVEAQTENSGELRIKQLMTHYEFEEVLNDGADYIPDSGPRGAKLYLKGLASISDANSIIGKNLWLSNPAGNAYGQITDNSVANYEDITISFWCFATTLVNTTDGDRWARVFDFGSGSTEYVFFTMLYRQNHIWQGGQDVMRCEFRYPNDTGGTENPELDVEGQFETGQWYFIAITIEADEDGEGGTGRIYLGGEHGIEYESPQRLNVAKMTEITQTIHYLGKGIAFSPPLFNGRIDDFKIYNYVRTSEEIAQDYVDVTGDESLCDLEYYDLYDYDFNFNCIVDLPDFAEIAANWLTDYTIYPAE